MKRRDLAFIECLLVVTFLSCAYRIMHWRAGICVCISCHSSQQAVVGVDGSLAELRGWEGVRFKEWWILGTQRPECETRLDVSGCRTWGKLPNHSVVG